MKSKEIQLAKWIIGAIYVILSISILTTLFI
jgi:hypothetical protein